MASRSLRPVVPVLGMHRSGTSLTTGILNALGVSLSEDLMPPTNANAIGYFESVSIMSIQDDVLAAIGSKWNGSETFKPFPAEWWRLPAVEPLKQRLKGLVSDELARAPGIWGFKDPRTCRLLPLWDEIFRELDLEPRYVLVSRHPLDIVKSLQARDGIIPLYSELLWLEHTADAIEHSKANLRAIIDYRAWFDDPVAAANYLVASLGLPQPQPQVLRDALDRLVSRDLRHHASAEETYALPFSREMYEALVARDRPRLQAIARAFHVTSVFTSRVVEFTLQNVVK